MALARILVVDDSPTIRRVVETALVAHGFAVVTAEDGERALLEAKAVEPDVIVLDFAMPGMNGYQVLKTFSDDEDLRDTPIVLLCTRSDRVPEDAVRGLGVVEIVTKPFAPDDIVARVRTTIERHGARRREETTPVLALPDEIALSGEPATDTGATLAAPSQVLDEDLAAAAALADLVRVLADALYARGIDDAEPLANAICGQVRAGLSQALLREFVSRELGVDVLRRPIPSLYGDLAAVPLPEVLQLLKLQGQTGVLEVSLNQARYEIGFRDGRVFAIRARNPAAGMRLGHYFVAQGAVTDADLERATAIPNDPRPLGQRLLESGMIDGKQLRDAVAAQAHDLMFEMLRAKSGVFGLRRGALLVNPPAAPGLSVDEILFEALRRVDEASVFRKEVPSLDTRFRRVASAGEDGLTAEEIEVLRALPTDDDGRPARTLKDGLAKSTHELEKLLFRLIVLKRVERAPARAPAPDEPPTSTETP